MIHVQHLAFSVVILTAVVSVGCEEDNQPTTAGAQGAGTKPSATAAKTGTSTAASAAATVAAPDASGAPWPDAEGDKANGDKEIRAKLASKSGSGVTGEVILTSVEDGVRVRVDIEGAKPGKHGIHFHEKADCSSDDGKSAGDHFNPEGHDHALPEKDERHVGDLGNIEADADGKGSIDFVRKGATLEPEAKTSLIGRGLIVHADPDDGGQPTGNAGDRIACAEIKAAP